MNNPDILEVGAIVNHMAVIYSLQGRYAEAETAYNRVRTIREKSQSANYPFVAKSLNDLAEHLTAEGKYAEAEPLYQRSLSILEKALGADHMQVALSQINLADL